MWEIFKIYGTEVSAHYQSANIYNVFVIHKITTKKTMSKSCILKITINKWRQNPKEKCSSNTNENKRNSYENQRKLIENKF